MQPAATSVCVPALWKGWQKWAQTLEGQANSCGAYKPLSPTALVDSRPLHGQELGTTWEAPSQTIAPHPQCLKQWVLAVEAMGAPGVPSGRSLLPGLGGQQIGAHLVPSLPGG